MITIEWHNNATCDNCGKENAPHCAQVRIEMSARPVDTIDLMLCSDCTTDLIKRLS